MTRSASMQTVQTATIAAPDRSTIRWGRVLAAGVLSELGVFAGIFIAIGAYSVLGVDTSGEASRRPEYYAAPAAALIATFLCALWAARKAGSRLIAHGLLVGVAAVLLSVGFIFGARPEDRLMYVISFVLRIVGGYAGGWMAGHERFQISDGRMQI
jgi:hypothetical protein